MKKKVNVYSWNISGEHVEDLVCSYILDYTLELEHFLCVGEQILQPLLKFCSHLRARLNVFSFITWEEPDKITTG